MPSYRADPAPIAALADALEVLGEDLAGMDQVNLTAEFPPGAAAPKVEDLILNWRQERLALARALGELSDRVRAAAAGYADAEGAAGR